MSVQPPPAPLLRDRSIAVLLDDAVGLYRRHFRLLVLLAATVAIPVDLIVEGIGLGKLTAGYDSSPSTSALVAPAVVSAMVTVPLLTAMVVRALLAVEAGRVPSVAEAARSGLELFAPILAAILLAGAGVFIGLLALVVPGVILAVHWSVVAQVVAVEGAHGPAALRRSWQLVRGDAWWTVGVLLVTTLLASVLSAVVMVPIQFAAESADSAAIELLGTIVTDAVTVPFMVIAATLTFFTLKARKEGVSAAPPSLAPAGWEPPRPG